MQLVFRGLLLAVLGVVPVLAQAELSAQAPGEPRVVTDTNYRDADFLELANAAAGSPREYETKLEAAGNIALRSRDGAARRTAADTIRAGLLRALAADSAMAYPFAGLRTVSQVSPADSSWRIFTWQLFVNDSTYRYYGVLQTRAAPAEPIVLRDSAQALGLEREFELGPEQWYGALYYNVHSFELADGRPAWVLFGFDADGFAHRRKVADVLSFGPRTGAPLFGAEVFVGSEDSETRRQARLILEYRTDARVGLNFDPALDGIVFDHLVTGPPVRRGDPPAYVPDGSYDGYVYAADAGEWRWRMEWFDRVQSAEPPRAEPAPGGTESRDLFGRPRDQKPE